VTVAGPRSFLTLSPTEDQLTRRTVLRRLRDWTDVDMGPKMFHGPTCTDTPLNLPDLIDHVYSWLARLVSSESAGAKWRVVEKPVRPPGDDLWYFRLGHDWHHVQAETYSSPGVDARGSLYLEFVAENLGPNTGLWAGPLFDHQAPEAWYIAWLTATFLDTDSWAFPASERAAAEALAVIDGALLKLFPALDASPLVAHEGSPWLLVNHTRVNRAQLDRLGW
jgi:hypothetical protein